MRIVCPWNVLWRFSDRCPLIKKFISNKNNDRKAHLVIYYFCQANSTTAESIGGFYLNFKQVKNTGQMY